MRPGGSCVRGLLGVKGKADLPEGPWWGEGRVGHGGVQPRPCRCLVNCPLPLRLVLQKGGPSALCCLLAFSLVLDGEACWPSSLSAQGPEAWRPLCPPTPRQPVRALGKMVSLTTPQGHCPKSRMSPRTASLFSGFWRLGFFFVKSF